MKNLDSLFSPACALLQELAATAKNKEEENLLEFASAQLERQWDFIQNNRERQKVFMAKKRKASAS